MSTVTDFGRYQACGKCGAELGKPCRALSGFGPKGPIAVLIENAHGGRPERAASTQKGADRG